MTNRHYLVSDEVELQAIREIAGSSPEWRLTETDQADPAGRYRLRVNGDVLSIERALTASWATATQLLNFSSTDIVVNEGGGDWDFRIEGDNNANMLVVDAGLDSMALGRAVVAGAFLALDGSLQARTRITSVGWAFHNPAATFIDSSTTRAVAVGARVFVGIPTFANNQVGQTLTITDAATITIAGPPALGVADGTVVFTRAHALHIVAGRTYLGGNLQLTDDLIALLGTDADIAWAHSSAGVAANTALTSVLVGTPVSQAVAANSGLFSNITASGDLAFYGNLGGNSLQWLLYDTSASRVYSWPNGVAGLDWTSAAATFASAASTANQVLTVQNTSNAAAASHSILDIAVGGTTSTGDPQLRWTIPGGTSVHAGIDNSASDAWFLGTGTTVGVGALLRFDTITSGVSYYYGLYIQGASVTANDSAVAGTIRLTVQPVTVTFVGQTTVTEVSAGIEVTAITLAQSGGALTVNKAAGIVSTGATAGASVTLTHSSAFRALTGGAAVNVSGLYVEAQTAGTTGNYQALLAVSTGAAPPLADHVGFTARDFAVGDTRLYIASEAGSDIILGNDTLRFAAAGVINTATGDLTLNPTDHVVAGAGVFFRASVTAGITASTTQTQGNGALVSEVNEVSVCANVNDTVTLPSAVAGMRCVVINNGAQTMRIFPASGDNHGSGADTARTLAAAAFVVFQAYDATNWEIIAGG